MKAFTIMLLALSLPLAAQEPKPEPKLPTGARLDAIEDRLSWLDAFLESTNQRSLVRYATLDCATGNFSFISPESSTLSFLVACEKVEPYLEGFQLTIAVGNPYSIVFSNASWVVSSGESIGKMKKTPFVTAEKFLPGTWTRVKVTITRAEAKDVRIVAFEDFELKNAGR